MMKMLLLEKINRILIYLQRARVKMNLDKMHLLKIQLKFLKISQIYSMWINLKHLINMIKLR